MCAQPDPICVRNTYLRHILLGKRKLFEGDEEQRQINKEGLVDALLVLFDECDNDFMKRDANISHFVERYNPVVNKLRKLRVNAADFEMVKVIGRGHFGQVHLAKEKQTGDIYAMKVIKKSDILAKQNIAFYEEEKDIMAKATSEWLTSLNCSFQDQENLYLVMEFHPGGDLLSLLSRRGGSLNEDEARFYLAELILALHSLHSMGYVHRDIKPENILLDRLGHLKLADFGSSVKLDSTGVVRSEMPVGTPDYVAPEVLTSLNSTGLLAGGYGAECDYWSLGILAYEMVYGSTPFSDERITGTYGNIMNFENSLKFPDSVAVSKDFQSLISQLLCKSSTRLNYNQLVNHTFFSAVDWNGLRQMVPPYVPVVTSLDDTSNFDDFSDDAIPPPTPRTPRAKEAFSGKNLPFIGFTFVKDAAVLEQSSSIWSGENPLQGELRLKNKEICELKRQLVDFDDLRRKNGSMDLLQQKTNRLQADRDALDKQLARSVRDADSLRRQLGAEKAARSVSESETVEAQEKMKAMAANYEKVADKERDRLVGEIEVWKGNWRSVQHEKEEAKSCLKTAMQAVDKLEEDCERWRIKCSKYKEIAIAARGHRIMVEKRCSVSTVPNETLVNLQQQLESERQIKSDLKQQLAELKNSLAVSEDNLQNRLAEQETKWRRRLTCKEVELESQLKQLEDKVLAEKENRIKDLELRLSEQMSECVRLRNEAQLLQKSLDDSLQWKSRFESSFCEKENELENRIKQLEQELRSTADVKLSLQQQLNQVSIRETDNLAKFETVVLELQEAIAKMEQRNKELCSKLSEQQVVAAQVTPDPQVEQLKLKAITLEEKIQKLEQQLASNRQNLAQEREKYRQLESDGWKKDKELSDAKIDLRIANRELKSCKEQNDKLPQLEKEMKEKLEIKDEELGKVRQELLQANKELAQAQCGAADLDRVTSEREKFLKDVEEAKSNSRKLSCELQQVKDEMILLNRQKASLESQLERGEERVQRYLDEKREVQERLDSMKKMVDEKNEAYEQLRETCAIMDDQLKSFENLLESSEKQVRESDGEKKKLLDEIEQVKNSVRSAKQQTNEEKSLKLFAESKLRDVESRLKTAEQDADSRVHLLASQVAQYSDKIKCLSELNSQLEVNLAESDSSLGAVSEQVIALREENRSLKEETASLRTGVISLKNSNSELNGALAEAISKGEMYKAGLIKVEAEMETLRVSHDEREMKLKSTLAQHSKLIDFLQAKTEVKKKTTLTDKLFGSHKKENQSSIPLAYRDMENQLQKKNVQVRDLNEQLAKCRAELAATKSTDSTKPSVLSEQARNTSATPLPYRALSKLTQSPGTQGSPSTRHSTGLVEQRMHHNIPHRMQSQMVMRATNCVVCLDTIHFCRQVSACQECGATVHLKCIEDLPSTCGLPVGLAQHFGTVIGRENKHSASEKNPSLPFRMEGSVKVPRPGKPCWDRKYMKLEGTKLCIYDHEPTSGNMDPIDLVELRPTDGTKVSIHSAVAQSEVLHSARTDLPFIFMVELIPKTTCWPGRTMFVMAPNLSDKNSWLSALEGAIESDRPANSQVRRKPSIQLPLKSGIDANCAVSIREGFLLVGAKEGLFTANLNAGHDDMVLIDGVSDVQQIVVVPKLLSVLMIVGAERQLVATSLRVLECCAESIACARPSVSVEAVAGAEECHLFSVSDERCEDTFLCAANRDRVKLFKWINGEFVLRKEIIVTETCSCIHFTKHSVLIGCDSFYEMDLRDFTVDQFLDASDTSLAYAVFGLKQKSSFPVAILEVTAERGEPEFLLCYHEFGIFVDGYGLRSRDEDVKWTRLALAFAYRAPYLFVLHFNRVEVMKLTRSSFKRNKNESVGSDDSGPAAILPVRAYEELSCPRYLGPAKADGSIYLFTKESDSMNIVRLDGQLVLADHGAAAAESETSSLRSEEQSQSSLDQSCDVLSTCSSDQEGHYSLKRHQEIRQSERSNSSKRVKFESNL